MRAPLALLAVALIGGAVAGSVATRWYDERAAAPDKARRDLVAGNTMPEAVADRHRSENFRSLDSVPAIFALPTAFARSEALYALAGRSDAAALQQHIFAADRIADDIERDRALDILFFRLAELDPPSALALARTDYFEGTPSLETTVWSAWARKDFDLALFAAKTQSTSAGQNTAAQALYAAFGFMGNETTDRIERELGIAPDRSQRARYLYRLADRSPREAIEYIEALPGGTEKTWNVNWLAYYLSLDDPQKARGYASLFSDGGSRSQFTNIVEAEQARLDPVATIENLLASGRDPWQSNTFHVALEAIGAEDISILESYFNAADSLMEKQRYAGMVIQALAGSDPAAALAWAERHDLSWGGARRGSLVTQALEVIAQADAEFAFEEEMKIPNPQDRAQVLEVIASYAAMTDPAGAAELLDRIPDGDLHGQATSQVLNHWLRVDPDAAIEWLVARDDDDVEQLLAQSMWSVVNTDIDAAMKLLSRVPEADQHQWRQQIAERLVYYESPAEAMAFVNRFAGEPGYEQMQAAVVAGVAGNDLLLAQQMADQLGSRKARDAAYVGIVQHTAMQDPRAALALLGAIGDETERARATMNVAIHWNEQEPEAAIGWVKSLEDGAARNMVISQMSYIWGRTDPDLALDLIAGMPPGRDRYRAQVGVITGVAQVSPGRAEALIDEFELEEPFRSEALETVNAYRRIP